MAYYSSDATYTAKCLALYSSDAIYTAKYQAFYSSDAIYTTKYLAFYSSDAIYTAVNSVAWHGFSPFPVEMAPPPLTLLHGFTQATSYEPNPNRTKVTFEICCCANTKQIQTVPKSPSKYAVAND